MHFCIDANRMIIMAPLQTTHISNLLSLHSVTQNSYNMRIVIAVRMVEKPEKKTKNLRLPIAVAKISLVFSFIWSFAIQPHIFV